MNYMFEHDMIKREEIGAVVVTGLTPDYFIPHISNIIHGECKLPKDVICMDIPQGCVGFVLGSLQALMLLDVVGNKKVVVFNTDVLCRKKERHLFLLQVLAGMPRQLQYLKMMKKHLIFI